MNGHTQLKQYFGYDTYRPGQEEAVSEILSGRDVLCIMPTGAGKSLCYQIPALMMDGITLVISPLISLMKDQVMNLVESGVRAAFINSSLTAAQTRTVMQRASEGLYKIIYVAPERLLSPDFLSFAESTNISMVTIDEAHCVSQWGHDFRTSYLEIAPFIKNLLRRPVVSAFTATATAQVRDDILNLLELGDPFVQVTGFDRKNLYFSVLRPSNKLDYLLDYLKDKGDESSIIYCATRKNVESVCQALLDEGFSATRYHAGLGSNERKQNQEDFVYERKKIMVATNAFGMGIDKSNVRSVVHYNMPKNLESYYQEAGRAGRDGDSANCLLLYSPKDVITNEFLIHNGDNGDESDDTNRELRIQNNLDLLKQMTFYSTTNNCLRHFILDYFGESSPLSCGACLNCDTIFEELNITEEAKMIISCVARIKQHAWPHGKSMVTDVLRGSAKQRIRELKLDSLSTYGIMKSYSAQRIYVLIDNLIESGYLSQSANEYKVLTVSAASKGVLYDSEQVIVKLPKEIEREKPKLKKSKQKYMPAALNEIADKDLFEHLRKLRTEIAAEERVPAYVVFSDATLRDMCWLQPQSLAEFSEVSGVGSAKLDKYGERFTEAIRIWRNGQ